MSFEPKDGAGYLFVNDRKEKDTHPDRTGTARIDGKDYYVNGWLNKTKDGRTYLSLAFKPKLARDSGAPPTGGRNDPRPQRSVSDEFDDDLPF